MHNLLLEIFKGLQNIVDLSTRFKKIIVIVNVPNMYVIAFGEPFSQKAMCIFFCLYIFEHIIIKKVWFILKIVEYK